MKKILLLEDDAALSGGIALALQSSEVTVTPCRTLGAARAALADGGFTLLILDVNLPDGSGLSLLREVRQSSAVPVLLLTANDLELDIVTGLESGADDYVTKPFSLAVLRARVGALLRRGELAPAPPYTCAGLRFDFDRLEYAKDGMRLELSKTEQKLLRLLVANRGQTLPRALLVERIWGSEEYVDENALSVTVKRLRGKLEDADGPRLLCTVYGIGYSWKEPEILPTKEPETP